MYNIGDKVTIKLNPQKSKYAAWNSHMNKYRGKEYVICGIANKFGVPLYKLESCRFGTMNNDGYWLFDEAWFEDKQDFEVTEDELMKLF